MTGGKPLAPDDLRVGRIVTVFRNRVHRQAINSLAAAFTDTKVQTIDIENSHGTGKLYRIESVMLPYIVVYEAQASRLNIGKTPGVWTHDVRETQFMSVTRSFLYASLGRNWRQQFRKECAV